MISRDKNANIKTALKDRDTNDKLLALILKKGKRDVSLFKKAFGSEPDFPPIEIIRENAWR